MNRNFLTEFIAGLPFIRRILNAIVGALPDITPELINSAMEGLVDDEYSNISYKVFNIGVANEVSAYSAEIGFPVEDGKYISAIDRILELTQEYEALGEVYLTSPMSLRFVKGSKAFLSPQYGYDTCMLEIIVVKDTQGSFEMMHRLENEMYKYSGRPHWGQVNTLTGSHNLIESMYPEYGKWLAVYRQLNKNGTFDSPFSKRVGFRKESFEANV